MFVKTHVGSDLRFKVAGSFFCFFFTKMADSFYETYIHYAVELFCLLMSLPLVVYFYHTLQEANTALKNHEENAIKVEEQSFSGSESDEAAEEIIQEKCSPPEPKGASEYIPAARMCDAGRKPAELDFLGQEASKGNFGENGVCECCAFEGIAEESMQENEAENSEESIRRKCDIRKRFEEGSSSAKYLCKRDKSHDISSRHIRVATLSEICHGKVRGLLPPNLYSSFCVYFLNECERRRKEELSGDNLVLPVKKHDKLTKPLLGSGKRHEFHDISPGYSRVARLSEVCDRKVRELNLPNLHSSSSAYSLDECERQRMEELFGDKLVVPVKTHDRLTKPLLGSGGLVIYEELAKYISIPDMKTNTIVADDIPHNLQLPQMRPVDELMGRHGRPIFARSHSGGGLTEEDSKISLPTLFPSSGL